MIALAIAAFGATAAKAQDAPPRPAEPEAAVDAEAPPADGSQDIVVTGTSIRGIAPVGSEVVAIGRDDIDASPAVTVSQMLLETPQVFNSGISEGSRNGPGGSTNVVAATAISLRGLGPFATLTLFDGERPVPNGTTGGFVDPSSIPTIALQRVEVIADGASAIYGSDAVAGVVNLVPRRSYDGLGIDARYGMGAQYKDAQISAILGQDWGSGRFTLAYQHSYRSNVFGGDRDFVTNDFRAAGNADFRATSCAPGNIVIGGISYAIPAGGATPANLIANTQNRCDSSRMSDLLPQQEYNSASMTFDQEISDGWRIWMTGYLSRRDAIPTSSAATQSLTVPRTNAFFVAPQGLNPASLTVQYSFADDFGPTFRGRATSRQFQIFGGTEIDLFADVRARISGSYGRSQDNTIRNALDTAAITTALASSDPANALNPFRTGTRTSQAVLDRISAFTDIIFGDIKQYTARLKVDGSLFDLPGGPVRFAVGADYLNVKVLTGTERGPNNAVVYFARDLPRNTKAAFGEVYLPLVSAQNAMPGIQKLELNFAGRVEEYSDAGVTKNPKIGVNWSPVNGLTLRSSYGTSFRAPNLTQTYTPAGGGLYLRNFTDPTANGGAGGIIQGVGLFADNLALKPETAKTFSLGAEINPFDRARLSLNYFNVVYEGQIIGHNNNTTILLDEAFYRDLIVRNPSQAFLQQYLDAGHVIQGGTATTYFNSKVFIFASNNNLGVTKTRGLDYQLDLAFPTASAGEFRFRSAGTYFLSFQVAPSAAAPLVERVNTIDYPLTFRNRSSLSWTMDGLAAQVALNYSNGYWNTGVVPQKRVQSYATVDLNIGYSFNGTGLLSDTRVGLEISNLFDRNPPFVSFRNGYDPQVANPTGRIVALTLGKKF